MDDTKQEWRAHSTQIARMEVDTEKSQHESLVVTNIIEEAILKNNHHFAKDWEKTQKRIDCQADEHQRLKTHVIELESLSGLQQTALQHCQDTVAGIEETVKWLVAAVCKLESTVCCCCDQLLSPGPHYAEGEEEEVLADLEEEEDSLEYETKAPLTASYTTPLGTGGCSKPSPHPSHSPIPGGSDPEDNTVLHTAKIEACIEAFLAEADEDLELGDLLPLEYVTPIPIHVPTIPGFVPFTVSTGQHCILSKGLPQAYHPYENSIGQCSCEAGGWCNNLPCSVSLDMIFTPIFCPFLTQLCPLSLPPLSPYACFSHEFFLLCLIHAHKWMTRTQFNWFLPVTDTTIYLAINTPKQSHSSSTT